MTIECSYEGDKASKNLGLSREYYFAMHADPEKFLSPQHIPGTPEWEEFHKFCQGIGKKFDIV